MAPGGLAGWRSGTAAAAAAVSADTAAASLRVNTNIIFN